MSTPKTSLPIQPPFFDDDDDDDDVDSPAESTAASDDAVEDPPAESAATFRGATNAPAADVSVAATPAAAVAASTAHAADVSVDATPAAAAAAASTAHASSSACSVSSHAPSASLLPSPPRSEDDYATIIYEAKSASQASARSRRMHVPYHSFTVGGDVGVRRLTRERAGQPCLLREMLTSKSRATGDISKAVRWGTKPMTVVHFAKAAKIVCAQPPLCATKAQLKASGTDAHAYHGILNDLMAGAMESSLFERCIAGHWSPRLVGPELLRDLSACMPNRYGDGAASMDQERALRRSVCDFVRSFVGTRPWHEAIPFQLGEDPSFRFLLPPV